MEILLTQQDRQAHFLMEHGQEAADERPVKVKGTPGGPRNYLTQTRPRPFERPRVSRYLATVRGAKKLPISKQKRDHDWSL